MVDSGWWIIMSISVGRKYMVISDDTLFDSSHWQENHRHGGRCDRTVSGGGTLEDIGIYCINAARYIFQAEPISVFATSASKDEERFQEVAVMTSTKRRK